MSRVPGKTRIPAQVVGCYQDPGTGERVDCTPPISQTQDESGSSTAQRGGGEGTQAADGQKESKRNCRNEVHGKYHRCLW